MGENNTCAENKRQSIETSSPRARSKTIDAVRGFAIFLMLWGHSIQYLYPSGDENGFFENPAFRFIYGFHMPLFMLISGYLFGISAKKRTLRENLVRRTQSLLQPIFAFSIISLLAVDALAAALSGRFLRLNDGVWLENLRAPWFLWSVLSASVPAAFAAKARRLPMKILILAAGVAFAGFMPCEKYNLFMYPYFAAGFLFGEYRETAAAGFLSKLRFLSIPAFFAMLPFYKTEYYIYITDVIGGGWKINLFRTAIGFFGSLCFITLFSAAEKIKIKRKPIANALALCGRYSLQIYMFSTVFLSGWLPLLRSRLPVREIFQTDTAVYSFLFTPAVAAVYCAALCFLSRFFEKRRINAVLFGR